ADGRARADRRHARRRSLARRAQTSPSGAQTIGNRTRDQEFVRPASADPPRRQVTATEFTENTEKTRPFDLCALRELCGQCPRLRAPGERNLQAPERSRGAGETATFVSRKSRQIRPAWIQP